MYKIIYAHTPQPAARNPQVPQEDHLRFLAKTQLQFFFLNRRCRRFHFKRAPAILQSIFASPDRTNQNDGSGFAVDCRITPFDRADLPAFLDPSP
jgi:hypothetical protein